MKLDKSNLISIIIPTYNEEKNVSILYNALKNELGEYNLDFVFVDDGSKDNTLNAIKEIALNDTRVKFLSFSRNFGHQKALMAGLNVAKGDVVISMDGDMQHPVNVIKQLISKWEQGYEIVYTIRKDGDIPFFKRITAKLFYKLINKLSDVTIEQGTADFRLLDKKVVKELKRLNELHIFYRGIVPWIGFKSIGVNYQAHDRLHGKSKYTLKKMFGFALDGIMSFSTKPLRVSVYVGMVIAFLSFLYALYAIYIVAFTSKAVSGWASTISVILFIGGFQLIVLGIIGEYIGKMFMENKNRPNYIIRETNIT